MPKYQFSVVIEQDEDGVYISSCPALQGCHSFGETYEEAIENVKDAIQVYLEAKLVLGETIPREIGIDRVEVSVENHYAPAD